MNDRFKFRAWDKRSNQMHYNDFIVTATGFISAINHCSNDYMTMYFEQNDLETDKNCVLMQCTGLKDKNGKLIYESDIVKFNYDTDEIIAVVSCDDNEGQVGYYLNTTDYFKDKYVTDYDFYKNDYEVIGNIYENKELLNENS